MIINSYCCHKTVYLSSMKYSCQTKEEEKQGRKETSISEQPIFRGKANQQNINIESFLQELRSTNKTQIIEKKALLLTTTL